MAFNHIIIISISRLATFTKKTRIYLFMVCVGVAVRVSHVQFTVFIKGVLRSYMRRRALTSDITNDQQLKFIRFQLIAYLKQLHVNRNCE